MTRSKVKELELPPITSAIVAHALGRYWHVIRGQETQAVLGVSEVPISARRTEPLYALANGEKIIVTSRAQIKERPPEADVVLRVSDNGKSSWLWHKEAERFASGVEKNGWERIAGDIQTSWLRRFNYRMELRNEAATNCCPPSMS